ncbi:MAG TPA: hypothetical protein VN031_02470 [Candidatus Microsaccharimonas sp.]|nr:hypothetical protein [Candidatus Microsaccharimonas sp.]
MSARFEQIHSNPSTTGEQPVSPVVRQVLQAIHNAAYKSELGRRGYFGGATLARKVREGVINLDEMAIISNARDTRKTELSASADTIPAEVPEPTDQTAIAQQEWSPTDILDRMPAREFDARERAAGEHLDRRGA